MVALDVKQLRFGAKLGLCWSFMWRGLVTTIGAVIAASVLGGVLGLVIGLLGVATGTSEASVTGTAQMIGACIGAVCGFVSLYFYVRWLLGSRLGRYRLVLLAADSQVAPAQTQFTTGQMR